MALNIEKLLENYEKPYGEWSDLQITRAQRKRLIWNFDNYKITYDNVKDLTRGQAQHIFSRMREVREGTLS